LQRQKAHFARSRANAARLFGVMGMRLSRPSRSGSQKICAPGKPPKDLQLARRTWSARHERGGSQLVQNLNPS